MHIRAERREDIKENRAVCNAAFKNPYESSLVAALRSRARPVVSLVAEEAGKIHGNIMFSPITLSGLPELRIMALAPMAVMPGHQRRGIGSALVRAGLEECRKLGFGAVVVLGHPDYRPRFGFTSAARKGIGCDYAVPAEALMLVELRSDYLRGATGAVRYHEVFKDE